MHAGKSCVLRLGGKGTEVGGGKGIAQVLELFGSLAVNRGKGLFLV